MNNFFKKILTFFVCFALVFSFVGVNPALAVDDDDDIREQIEENRKLLEEKEKELEALNEKIRTLREKRELKKSEEVTIRDQIEQITSEIEELKLFIQKTGVLITRTNVDIQEVNGEIDQANERLWQLKRTLRELFEMMYEYQTLSHFEVIFLSDSISDILRQLEYATTLQAEIGKVINDIQMIKKELEDKKAELDMKKLDLENLQASQEYQKDVLKKQMNYKDELLKQNIAKQTEYTVLIAEAMDARREIGQQIFRLTNSNITLALVEAKDYAWYAESLTGVRAAFLLAVLKIESNIGGNVGTGRYPDDVRPGDRDAFVKICKELGLDPKKTPVSAKPKSYEGWGGAMGPAQIMPTTWLKYKEEVARLTGNKTPNPWDTRDAFLASAIILRNYGAVGDSDNEYEAANRYFAGSNWKKFTWYGDRVMAVAKEYEKVM